MEQLDLISARELWERGPEAGSENMTSEKLVKGHAYSVTGAEEVSRGSACRFSCGFPRLCWESGRELIQLIRIRNPWGMGEWKGPWSDGATEWNEICWKDRGRLRHRAEDGEFWMSFSDFLRNYTCLEICNLSPDALADTGVKKWTLSTFEGSWRRGSTAGGCLNNHKTFWTNPQFVIKLNEEDNYPLEGCSFVVDLIQKNRRQMTTSECSTLGSPSISFLQSTRGRGIFACGVRSSSATPRRPAQRPPTGVRCAAAFACPPGEYVIIPSTFKPEQNGDFCLRVFFQTQDDLRELDDQVESNVKGVEVSEHEPDTGTTNPTGQHVAETSELSAFELRNFLNREIKKCADIHTEGFSLETCRHMVNLLDVS